VGILVALLSAAFTCFLPADLVIELTHALF
jgi:hypothetical protein